jgi:hypothetical protein
MGLIGYLDCQNDGVTTYHTDGAHTALHCFDGIFELGEKTVMAES